MLKNVKLITIIIPVLILFLNSCSKPDNEHNIQANGLTVAAALTEARTANGMYISWKEHIIDDEIIGDVQIRGSDGLVVADLDLDGYPDIVSVHESDTEYDGVADGHIRLAFGSGNPDQWELATLAEGIEAAAPEDVAIGDINGDGFPDIIAACELAHLIYFENPGVNIRSGNWKRLIPDIANNRGSFIRVFLADLDGDKRLEIIATNKGAQDPTATALIPKPVSWFEINGQPLDNDAWIEHEFTRLLWPINAQPVDLDSDGDIDVVAGSVAEGRIMWFENFSGQGNAGQFKEHRIDITWSEEINPGYSTRDGEQHRVNGFNMDFTDMDADGRLDIVLFEAENLLGDQLGWLEQPPTDQDQWRFHYIGNYRPDVLVGIIISDVNQDGHPDIMTGGYSFGDRDTDGEVPVTARMGRLAWFENTGSPDRGWIRHDISRRKRGMYDKFVALDLDGDGDPDYLSTRGNSSIYDGVLWLEQVRTPYPVPVFQQARTRDSQEMPLPRD